MKEVLCWNSFAALLPSERVYSVRDVVGHRMHECPSAWAAGGTSHTSVSVPGRS